MAKSLLFELIGNTLVVVQNDQPIDDAEWVALTEATVVLPWSGMVIWVETVMPNAAQRTLTRKALERRNKPFKASLLTASPMARTIISIFSIFVGNQLKGFAPTDVEGAMTHAEVSAENRSLVVAALGRMRAELRPIKPKESTSA
jgi:hypothetical protein